MGQYEPNDSRDVTNTPSTNPIEPTRTGPREGETRDQDDRHGEASAEGADGGLATDNPVGDAEPEYNQYRINQPGVDPNAAREPVAADNAGEGSDKPEQEPKGSDVSPVDKGTAQGGYGNARDGQGHEEQDEAEAPTAKTPTGYTQMAQQQQQGTQMIGGGPRGSHTDRDDPEAASPPEVSHDMPEGEAAIPGEIAGQGEERLRADANPAVLDPAAE